MFDKLTLWSAIAAVLSIALFSLSMVYFSDISRIFLSVSYGLVCFLLICLFDRYILTGVDLYVELVKRKNVAVAITLASIVYLMAQIATLLG